MVKYGSMPAEFPKMQALCCARHAALLPATSPVACSFPKPSTNGSQAFQSVGYRPVHPRLAMMRMPARCNRRPTTPSIALVASCVPFAPP